MVFERLGCKLITWFLVVSVLGIAVSITYNYLWVDGQYADTPANTWLLVGGVTSTSATFRIRLAQRNGAPLNSAQDDARLVISGDPGLSQILSEHSLLTQEVGGSESEQYPASNPKYGIHAITVTGLSPSRRFYYGVRSSFYGTSLVGRFQTPPPDGTAFNFSIATASCAMTGSKHQIFDYIRKDHPNLQFFMHMGDFHYEDIATDSLTERLDAVSTVLNSELQADLFRSVPLVYTWDDHDYVGNEEPNYLIPTNQVRDSAQISYQQAFPHYPLAAAPENATDTITPTPIYHAFTQGTVRFIVSDLQSEKTDDSMYSSEQQDWLFQELQQADQYDFVVWVTSKPWIGTETPGNTDSTAGSWIDANYAEERAALSNLITQSIAGENGPRNLLVLAGDAHMVAFDRGTNTYYGDDGTSDVFSFPILQSAPLDRLGSSKGGPYSEGCWSNEVERTHQYSTLFFEFPDSGEPCIIIESFRVDEWDYKERIFYRRLCGDIFSRADPQYAMNNPQTCQIALVSGTTQAFYIAAVAVSFSLGIFSCLIVACEPGSKESLSMRSFCGLLTTFIAWFATVLVVFMAPFVPVTFYDIYGWELRWTLVISMSTSVLMALVLFVVFFCCRRKPLEPEQPKRESSALNYSEPVNESVKRPAIARPSVFRTAATIEVDDEEQLPQGVVLTGGMKLHQEGLKGSGVRVAVIDSGVDQDHPGFKGSVKEKNWIRSGTPLEEDDHGTHVAGTIHLMAPEAEIYDYRVFGKDGTLSVDQAIAKSIRAATDSKCQIINMSLGGPFPNDLIWEAVQYASSKGVVMVCAAGNEGDNNPLTNEISFPASYKECLSIAAVGKVDGLPVAVFSNSNPLIDYAGIGVDVTSFKPGGGFQNMSGTSMASPHVAGLVACLMSNGQTSANNIRDILDGLAIDVDAVGVDNATGVGFVTYLNKDEFNKIMPTTPPAGEGIETGISPAPSGESPVSPLTSGALDTEVDA